MTSNTFTTSISTAAITIISAILYFLTGWEFFVWVVKFVIGVGVIVSLITATITRGNKFGAHKNKLKITFTKTTRRSLLTACIADGAMCFMMYASGNMIWIIARAISFAIMWSVIFLHKNAV